jgi:PAS domain S-box-containing protein
MENSLSFLDMRTLFFTMVVTNLVCTLVLVLLWRQNYKRLDGIGYWVADYALQTLAVVLIVLRGKIPEWISIDFANTISLVGIYFGLRGLEKFFHFKKKNQWYNYVLLALFSFIITWMTYVHPDLAKRNLMISIFSFLLCFQCVWLLFFRMKGDLKRMTHLIGVVFILFCVIDLFRVFDYFLVEHLIVNYFDAGSFEVFVILSYKILLVVLTFGLALLFNRSLLNDIALQENKFSKAFHTSPYAIILSRLSDNHILEINETFYRITGYHSDEMVGNTTLMFNFWENPSDRIFVLKELAENRAVMGKEFNFRNRNGDRFTGLYSAQIITINNEECLMSSINDISERKKAEEELKESEAKFRSLFARMSEGFALHEILYDAHRNPVDYRILEVNQAFEKLVGISAAKAKDQLASHVYGLKTAPFLDIYAEVAATGEPQSFQSHFPPLDKFYEITAFSPSHGFFATIFSDITEQRKSEEALMNSEIRLRNLNATKDKFFSIIAHDLKSPFNSILGFSKLLGESVKTKDFENVGQYASIIERSTQRTMDLLMNLLEWSRSQTGRIDYLPEYLEVNYLLNEVLELLEQTALQKAITIHRELAPFVTVYADRVLLSTILRNLLSNAVKFTQPGGEIHLSALKKGGMMEFCVRDNGVGIKNEDLKKLFRIEEGYSRKGTLNEQGTGLGLLLCKEFVEKQGGTIRVESELGKGSAFYFTLPCNL